MGSGFLSAPVRSTSENSFFFFFYYGDSEAPLKVILMRVFCLLVVKYTHYPSECAHTARFLTGSSLFSSGNSRLKLSD